MNRLFDLHQEANQLAMKANNATTTMLFAAYATDRNKVPPGGFFRILSDDLEVLESRLISLRDQLLELSKEAKEV